MDTTPPQLLVTNHNDGLTLSRRLGARVGAVTPEALEEFLQHDPTDADELVYQGPPPAEAVRRLAARRHVRLRSFTEFQGMLDLGDYVDGQTARLRADPYYPPHLYVPQRYRDLRGDDHGVREDLAAGLMDILTEDEGRFVLVLVSPLQRARRTAELAGLTTAEVEPDLVEWDYGGYEGLTTAEIRAQGHSGWLIFTDGVVAGPTPGETLEQVAQRGRRVLDRVRPALEAGDVALVGHGHALRVLACDWLGRAPDLGQELILDARSVSVLGEEHDVPAIRHWSVSPPG